MKPDKAHKKIRIAKLKKVNIYQVPDKYFQTLPMVVWNRIIGALGVAWLVLIFGCEDPGEIGLGFIPNDNGFYFSDTVTVSTSTVTLDSLPTSGTGIILVGEYTDLELGQVSAKSYFQVGLSSTEGLSSALLTNDQESVFDSLALVMHFTGYSYGDTTKAQTLNVQRIIQTFEPPSGSVFHNSSQLAVEEEPLASITFVPRPNQFDSIIMRLPDALGQEFFDLAMSSASEMSSQADFLEYFKGLAIVADRNGGGSVLGFDATGTSIFMRLYYHDHDEMVAYKSYTFPLINEQHQFNYLQGDRSNTTLSVLQTQRESLSAAETGEQSFVQAGTGVMTKIEFPYLANLTQTEGFFIINAELEIRPVQDSYSQWHYLPDSLILYQTDEFNTIGEPVPIDFSGSVQYAGLNLDEELNLDTYYSFSLTEYLENEVFQSAIQHGLLLATPPGNYTTTVDRLYVGSNRNQENLTRLKLNYIVSNQNIN